MSLIPQALRILGPYRKDSIFILFLELVLRTVFFVLILIILLTLFLLRLLLLHKIPNLSLSLFLFLLFLPLEFFLKVLEELLALGVVFHVVVGLHVVDFLIDFIVFFDDVTDGVTLSLVLARQELLRWQHVVDDLLDRHTLDLLDIFDFLLQLALPLLHVVFLELETLGWLQLVEVAQVLGKERVDVAIEKAGIYTLPED